MVVDHAMRASYPSAAHFPIGHASAGNRTFRAVKHPQMVQVWPVHLSQPRQTSSLLRLISESSVQAALTTLGMARMAAEMVRPALAGLTVLLGQIEQIPCDGFPPYSPSEQHPPPSIPQSFQWVQVTSRWP